MSKILETNTDTGNPLSHFVKTDDGKYYYVDSCWSGSFPIGNGYETMAIPCNKNLHISPKNWQSPEYVETYGSEKEMAERHEWIIRNLESCLAIYD